MDVGLDSISSVLKIIDTLNIIILSTGGDGVFVRFPSYFFKIDLTEVLNEVVLVAKKNFPSLWELSKENNKFKPYSLPMN